MNVNDKNILTTKPRGRGNWRKVRPIQVGASFKAKPSKTYTISSSNINWRTPASKENKSLNSSTLQTSTSHNRSDVIDDGSRIIVALSEGRGDATCEVGLAAINIAEPNIVLCQMPDLQSYIHTITKLNILNPVEILVPMTFVTGNRMTEILKSNFPNVKITAVCRSWYNNTNGFQSLSELCATHWKSTLLKVKHKFFTLTAFNALVNYLLIEMSTSYGKETLKVDFQVPDGYAIIDISTATNLELVTSTRAINERYSSLMGVLNHCKTKMGARLLRANILQPPAQVDEINSRLDCVQELLDNPILLTTIQESLCKLSSIHRLLSISSLTPPGEAPSHAKPPSTSRRHLDYLLILNSLMQQSITMREALTPCNHDYLTTLRELLDLPVIEDLRRLIGRLLYEDTVKSSGEGVGRVGAEYCAFVIKPGVCPLLDVVRTSYTDKIKSMRDHVKSLSEKHFLTLTLNNTTKKGYHMVMQISKNQRMAFKKSSLPPEFIQVNRLLGSITMKTADLINLADRAEAILLEIIKLSNIILSKTLADIRKHTDVFFVICEYIAKLDMMQSLAKASSVGQTARPRFGAYTQVVESRHPLLCYLRPKEPIANDIHVSPYYNLNIITGANGSGKSVYIRQVILLQVMAQVGCFVPAKSAIFRVADRILARVTLNDDMENHASAFVLEMKEIDYFLTVLTDNTLIVIDELGRSTSLESGTAIALAFCKKLQSTKAFTFITTHFTMLPKIQKMYLNCKNWHMETLETDRLIDNKYKTFHFTYTLKPGVVTLTGYGIYFARICWPKRVMEEVERSMAEEEQRWEDMLPDVEAVHPLERIKYDCESDLQLLPRKTKETVRERLLKYQDEINEYLRQESEIPTVVELSICKDSTLDEEMAQKLQPEVVYEDTTNNSSTLQDEPTRRDEASASSRVVEESTSSNIGPQHEEDSNSLSGDGSTSLLIRQKDKENLASESKTSKTSSSVNWGANSSKSKGNSDPHKEPWKNLEKRSKGHQSHCGGSPAKRSKYSKQKSFDAAELESIRSDLESCKEFLDPWDEVEDQTFNTQEKISFSSTEMETIRNDLEASKEFFAPWDEVEDQTLDTQEKISEMENIRGDLESCKESADPWDVARNPEHRTVDTLNLAKSFDSMDVESCKEDFLSAWNENEEIENYKDLDGSVSSNIQEQFLARNNDEMPSQDIEDLRADESISYSPKLNSQNVDNQRGLELEPREIEDPQEMANMQSYVQNTQEMYEIIENSRFEQQNVLQYITASQNFFEDYEVISQNQFGRFSVSPEVAQNDLLSPRIHEENLVQEEQSSSDYHDFVNGIETGKQNSQQEAFLDASTETAKQSVSSYYQSVISKTNDSPSTSVFKHPSVIASSKSSKFKSPIYGTTFKDDVVKKRSKFVTPFKSMPGTSNAIKTAPQKRGRNAHFKPLERLTRKEIEEDFWQQDMKLMEDGGAHPEIDMITNRPSVKQLQRMTCVVLFDDSGQPIFNPGAYNLSEKNRFHKRNKKFTTPLKYAETSNSMYDSFRESLKQDSNTSGKNDSGYNMFSMNERANISLFAEGGSLGAASACASTYFEIIEQDASKLNQTATTEELMKKYLT